MIEFRAANNVIEKLRNFDPWFAPREQQPQGTRGNSTDGKSIWMSFPYSEVWAKSGISRAIRGFIDSPFGQHMLLEAWGRPVDLDLRIAWKLTSPSHVQRVGG